MIKYILKKFSLLLLIFMCVFFLLPLAVIGISYNEDFKGFINVNQEDVIIKLYRHETDSVEELKLEEYLEGVLAAEMPVKFDIEALKAQAVTSRTYAISKVISGVKIHNVAHVCDTVHSQAYIDESMYEQKFGSKKDEYIEKIRRAIDETRGEVLYYNDEIVNNALYFAISSGYTENSSDVFSFDEPYLKSVNSLFDQDAPNVTKEYVFSEREFVDRINNKYSNANVKNYDDIEILGYTESGSIYRIRLGNEIIRGLDFRYLFELNSSNIDMKKEDNNIVIKVRGYGHGVGLSQWGAGKMAELGYKYDEILKHYYSGVKIKKVSI
ncbi:Stage II sporulation protein D [Candidatus Arthromitus sp. SFB-mouse-NL]|uniref:stage II sporulation protein D n=1 Tax=Candidatus Arthromitus sp. SFB-mouse-NL TaxID=1508644 RepID=UPI000499B82D|nr:stage II sporulation protein D [Candidatus Arthromitus sp. SFB-mouse-NL]AID45245.1 Stage II sporulation protein D [Candidatus Arthromitus sp. SFB-mouse-NL]